MKRTLIDSGVLIAAAIGTLDISVPAREVLDDPDRQFVSSDFVRLEVSPKAIYHRQDEEFHVDLGCGDPVVGAVQMVPGNPVLEALGYSAATLPLYHVATTVAEKLHAYTLPSLTTNMRVKDLVDLVLLMDAYDFDAQELRRVCCDIRETWHPPVANVVRVAALVLGATLPKTAKRDRHTPENCRSGARGTRRFRLAGATRFVCPENIASIRVAERAVFSRTGLLETSEGQWIRFVRGLHR